MNDVLTSLIDAAPFLARGAATTLGVWLLACLLGISIGTLFGLSTCKKLRFGIASDIIDFVTFVLRGIPVYVQLLIVYFVLPELLGINLSPFVAGTLSLSLCSAGYLCQIIRSGINSIPQGQWEACYVLGYSTFDTVRYIIAPQMLRNVAPALAGEFDQLLKSTSLLSSIGFLELTRVGMNIIAREMNPMSMYLTIAAIYLCMSWILNITRNNVEKRLAYAH